jgi:SAM-dependent methyltransferase
MPVDPNDDSDSELEREAMADFHFVEDYEKHVALLIAEHPLDKAMELAVGGAFDQVGHTEFNILKHAGLKSGMSVFDLGCGSGRLANKLGDSGIFVNYTGIDIVQALLDYAKTKSPDHFKFALHRDISIPADDSSIDIVCAFSVFTHLLHYETYLYLEDMRRVLKSNGCIVFSFLEFAVAGHWRTFSNTVAAQRSGQVRHLNTFIERNVIEVWCGHLGLEITGYIHGRDRIGDSEPLGQSTVILRRPI